MLIHSYHLYYYIFENILFNLYNENKEICIYIFIIFNVSIWNFLIYFYIFFKIFYISYIYFFIILGKRLYIDFYIILYFIPHSISLIYFYLFLIFILLCCYVYIDSLYFNYSSLIIKLSYFL